MVEQQFGRGLPPRLLVRRTGFGNAATIGFLPRAGAAAKEPARDGKAEQNGQNQP
jgi:hypothetical protein